MCLLKRSASLGQNETVLWILCGQLPLTQFKPIPLFGLSFIQEGCKALSTIETALESADMISKEHVELSWRKIHNIYHFGMDFQDFIIQQAQFEQDMYLTNW